VRLAQFDVQRFQVCSVATILATLTIDNIINSTLLIATRMPDIDHRRE